MKILFVEADNISINIMKDILHDGEYEVKVVKSGREAIELLKAGYLVDVVITDIKIPDIDGFGLIKFIRNSLRYRHLPVILTTALNDKKTILRATEFGLTAYLLKPIDKSTLLVNLDKVSKSTFGSVLIVDDEELIRSLLTKVLEREGLHILTAVDGVDALRILEEKSVSLIISDIKMPNMTGTELLINVKEKYPDIPVMLMTGFGLDFTKQEAIASGADDYITKPFKNVEIAHKIRVCLMRSKRHMAKS